MSSPTVSLTEFNTFGLAAHCQQLIRATNQRQLIAACLAHADDAIPALILGGGSNMLLLEDYLGTVIKIETRGIEVSEDAEYYHLTVAAGESWHGLVEFCLQQNIAGLENLALIPGTVGAAPIQNIGAYGIEFAAVCEWVEYLDLRSGEIVRLTHQQCQFGYRDSIFKRLLRHRAVILQVGMRLSKRWQAIVNYGPLQSLGDAATSQAIFDTVCRVRREKLPDPEQVGNVGSFFENPRVTARHFAKLKQQYPQIVGYPQADGQVKLAAGWLIDALGLKGESIGGAAVHQQQALVLINQGQASSADVLALAQRIIERVKAAFEVELIMEPRAYGARGEWSNAQ
ncbi:UDP-N-acetylenolpyruvoylglucosamine reductase [Shewanella mangrovi]|uniref:UDP-N-acetylenolpyruvoylglucosamine reductase n=1 Tax=Shewanella mangrovi TaxID=1515746 RepID=A0A094J7T0_9GAMM|nr:UDP-N-acetylmuramate dehydrogenase [Shewanella mangrovi]KFZ35975.1 UDP-N-acetylenolpyruvoylglucosamine reductase [Shewanella mangrovi]